jgi:DNA-binding protein HU-beta
MNKQQLIQQVAQQANTSQQQAQAVTDALMNTIQQALSQGDSVQLKNLGTWTVKDQPARQGRNPQTGEALAIGPNRRVLFRASEPLKRAVNQQVTE